MLFIFFISGLAAAFFIGKTELKNIFTPAMENRTISFRTVAFIAFFFVVMGAVSGGKSNTFALTDFASFKHIREVLFVDATALIVYFVFVKYKYPVSLVQLLLGGTIGWLFFSNQMEGRYFFSIKIIIIWILTPVLAALVAYVFYVLLRKFFLSSKIHLLKIETIIRVLFITSCVLFAFGLGVNNIPVAAGVFHNYFPETTVFGKFETATVFVLLFLGGISAASGILSVKNNEFEDKEYLSLDVWFSALFVSALFLIVFTYVPAVFAPLSASQLVLASLIGISLSKGNKNIEWTVVRKATASILLFPVISAFLVFIIMSVFYSFIGKNIDSNWVYLPDKMLSYEFPVRLNIAITMAVILVLLFVTFYTIFLYFNNKKKADEKVNRWKEQVQFSEYQKALSEIEKNTVQLENTNLASQLDNKQKELITYSINIGEQRQYLDSMYKSLQKALNAENVEVKNAILNEELITIKQKMTYSTELENIYQQAELVHISFMEKLNSQYPDLSSQEKRLMMLLRIGLSSKEIAPLLNISIKSVEISRYRLRKKLNLGKNTNLIQFTKNL